MSPIETSAKSEARKKRIILIVIGVLAFLYIGPGTIVRFFLPPGRQRMQDQRRAPVTQNGKPVAAQGNVPVAVVSSPAPAVPIATSRLLGFWGGSAMLVPDRGFCTLALEVRPGDGIQKAAYKGFASLNCPPSPLGMMANKSATAATDAMMARARALNPAAAALLGDAKDDSIVFRVDYAFGIEESILDCPMTSATLHPFGTDTVAFKWTEKSCAGGEMLLRRERR